MSIRYAGLTISGGKVILVDAIVPENGPIVLQADHTWSLQHGPREDAYHVMYLQIANYLREHGISRVVLKSSAVSARAAMKLAHLESAEVRGVVIAAARSVCEVSCVKMAVLSRTFGDRKAEEYVRDDVFWRENISGVNLRVGSREAALLIIADRSER